MNLNFFKISVVCKFLILNCQIFFAAFGADALIENKDITYDGNLQNNEWLKNVYENIYPVINNTNSVTNVCDEESVNVEKSSWFFNVPLLPVIVATSNSIPEGLCKRQLQLYLNDLKNGTLWATEMFDSSAKYPYGVFDGFTRHLGSFDQCKRIKTRIVNEKNGKIDEIRSRYCLVDVKFKEKNEPSNFTERYEIFFDPQVSAWEAIREKGDFRRYQRYLIQMALCFPADCKTEEIVAALKQPLDKFGKEYNLQVEASILPMFCSRPSEEVPKFSIYEIIFYFILFLILTIVIISTIIDKYFDQGKKISFPMELLSCFSARRNLNEIFRINYTHRGFDSIHSIRVFIAVLVVLGHRILQCMYAGNITGRYVEWVFSNPIFGVFHNLVIIADGFFGVGGLLLSYFLLGYLKTSGKLNFVLLILKRLVRLLPLFMVVTFGYATILYRLGSGPFWEYSIGLIRDSCASYWWTNLLLVNNYFGSNTKCVIQSWYLAVDFHCYIIGILLISAFNKMPRKTGYIFLGCTLIISTAIPFYFTYKYDLEPLLRVFTNPKKKETVEYFIKYYIKTHMRLGAYVAGLIVGVYIFDYKKANWRLSKTRSQILFITTLVLIFTISWSGTLFMNPNLKINLFVKALYASLQRPIYAFCICSIPLLLTIGDGLDFYYNVLTARWFQPLSRISYGIFLIHLAAQHYELGTTRTAFTFTPYNLFKFFIGDIVFTICLALFFSIVIEFPFKNFGNVIVKRYTNLGKSISSPNIPKKEE